MQALFFISSFRFKHFLCYLFVLVSFQTFFAQKSPSQLSKYSHTQFLNLLTATKDSVFRLSDAFIYFDKKKDSAFYYENRDDFYVFTNKDTLTIDVALDLKNVHFEHRNSDDGLAFHHLKFNKSVKLEDPTSVFFSNCTFEKQLTIEINVPVNKFIDYFELHTDFYFNEISLNQSQFKGGVVIDVGTIETFSAIFITITNSVFNTGKTLKSSFAVNNIRSFDFFRNSFKGDGIVDFFMDKSGATKITNSDFGQSKVLLYQAGIESSSINIFEDNIYRKPVLIEVENFNKTDTYRWNEWEGKVSSFQGYSEYIRKLYIERALNSATYENLFYNDSIFRTYVDTYKYKLENAYKYEKRLLGSFYDHYKSQYDTDFANTTYITLKDLDTARYEYLNAEKPSFKSYFTWKINQFLKVFSAYGTAPSKSIIISIYVIFIFAFVYLFFPNSWDTMNKNRLIKRIRFYTRYFRNKESMKQIYQEEKQTDLMTFNEFRLYMQNSHKEVPSYFLLLAKPIYYFSLSNYRIISKLFDSVDILKGKWVDLPKNKKIIASLFMGIWIVILLILDLIIKFINALTLSINTFTTLGFGEIPTKGFPRYLSIVQGFIGWFMLSIFSVSLISQLLN